MTRWGWLVLLGLTGCSAHRFECKAHGGDAVFEVESTHFTVAGELPPDDLKFEVTRLERLWDAYSVFFNHEPTESTSRLPVVMMQASGPAEFIAGTAGFMSGSGEPVLVTAKWKVDSTDDSSTAHELVHLISRSWLPRQPRWLAEGLAEYLGDAQFTSSDTVRFGRWKEFVSGGVVPLEALWAWKPRDQNDKRTLYLSAWGWLHYFANRDEVRLQKLWVALQQPVSAREAFESVFPSKEWPALYKQVEAYIAKGRFQGWESRTRRTPQVSAPRELTNWEVHLVRRSIFEKINEPAKAAAEGALALEVSPTPTPHTVAIARIEDTLFGPERTDALAAFKDTPEGALAWAAGDDLSLHERLAALTALRERQPDSLETLLAFSRIALRLHDERALEAAQRARALAPWSFSAALLEARAAMAVSRCTDATMAALGAKTLASELGNEAQRAVDDVEHALKQCREAK